MFFDFFLPFLRSQFLIQPPYPTHDFSGQTIIVTGANGGLGLEAARHFTRLNAAKVILAVRSTAKGEAAKKDIAETTGLGDHVEVWLLDLASYASVKEFVNRAESLSRVDALVCNAGIQPEKFILAENNESTVTVNVISTFLLALLMLPKLHATATRFNVTPSLSIVTSELHYVSWVAERTAPSIFKELAKETTKLGTRYPTSKMLEVLYCKRLAPAMAKSGKPTVTLNFVNPGWCHSDLVSNGFPDGAVPLPIKLIMKIMARTTEVGGRAHVAAAAAGHETHGQYLSDCVVAPYSYFVDTPEGKDTSKRIWDELNDILEEISPGVTKNI